LNGNGGGEILLVEDNETILEAFSILLTESGYPVIRATSGRDALELAEEHSPGLVLLDLGLPDMSGLDVVRTLKAQEATAGIPVIAITGHALDTDRDACIAAGCDGYVTKPVDTRQLLDLIPTHIVDAG
jgi:two-component system, cell cycle response regulator DivK